jgi:hypothetical protein
MPVEHAVECDEAGGFVGEVDGGTQALGASGDAEDASSGGDELTVCQGGAGVEDVDAGETVGFGDAADR